MTLGLSLGQWSMCSSMLYSWKLAGILFQPPKCVCVCVRVCVSVCVCCHLTGPMDAHGSNPGQPGHIDSMNRKRTLGKWPQPTYHNCGTSATEMKRGHITHSVTRRWLVELVSKCSSIRSTNILVILSTRCKDLSGEPRSS